MKWEPKYPASPWLSITQARQEPPGEEGDVTSWVSRYLELADIILRPLEREVYDDAGRKAA